jgi:hypothetical protein
VREVEPPRDEIRDRFLRRLRGSRAAVRPEDGDPDRAGVEPLRVRPDDVALGASEPPMSFQPLPFTW